MKQWCPIIEPHPVDFMCCEYHIDRRYVACRDTNCMKYITEVGREQIKAKQKLGHDGKGGVDD